MFDVAQVEVLKGPQALFYGKNSTAGVISLRSADPTDEFELVARGGYESEAEEKTGEAIVSGPVASLTEAASRGALFRMDGFFTNNGVPIPGFGNVLAEAHAISRPRRAGFSGAQRCSSRTTFTRPASKSVTSTTEWKAAAAMGRSSVCPDGTGGVPPRNVPFIGDSDCSWMKTHSLAISIRRSGRASATAAFLSWTRIRSSARSSKILRFTPAITLTSVTGLYDIEQENLIRGSGSSNPTIAADFSFENSQFTEELRLTSDFDRQPSELHVGRASTRTATSRSSIVCAAIEPSACQPLLQAGVHDVDIRSISAFGQVIWKVTEQVEIAARRSLDGRRARACALQRTDQQRMSICSSPRSVPTTFHPNSP